MPQLKLLDSTSQRVIEFHEPVAIIGRELFMSDERARQLGVELMPTLEDLVAESDFLVLAVPKLPENVGMISAELLRQATGAPPQPGPFLARLRAKYGELYGL